MPLPGPLHLLWSEPKSELRHGWLGSVGSFFTCWRNTAPLDESISFIELHKRVSAAQQLCPQLP